ncbi:TRANSMEMBRANE PROTEIN [Salix koriyanagi]|uniref:TRANSMEMBRANE PROTEIN n=1 Tax=Salix koriyanagi TaxID=2511006 RepID=A0A9Q0P3W9_9ROSI|nr:TRANSMEMBRANE PROTEIN [Salix koriyanagi]
MPESFEIFDKEKAGKADDMRENNRKRSVYYFLERVGALLVLLWCSFSCFPVITHTASRYLSFLNQKIYAFVLANVFILIVVYLSSTTLSNDNDQRDTPTQTDIYDEYVSFSTSSPQWKTTTAEDRQLVVSSMLEEPAQAEEKNPVREKDTLDDEKQIVCCEKTKDAVNADEMGKKTSS